jgi:stage VI sporulation protein D
VESPFQQLRFDISEKVRLHPQQPGIDTLLELDLYPDVEIKDEGQHLKIQGYLRLNGSYYVQNAFAGEESHVQVSDLEREADRQELAYVIPVEITLPADRAGLGQIATEVEEFDYQVISPFELQIEAILMIDGILPEQTKETAPIEEYTMSSFELETPPPVLSMVEEEDEVEAEPPSKKEAVSLPPEKVAPSVQPSFDLPVTEEGHSPPLPSTPSRKQQKLPTEFALEPQTDEEFSEKPQGRKEKIKLTREQSDPLPSEVQSEGDDADSPLLGDQEVIEEYIEEPTGIEWIDWLVRSKEESFVPMRMVIVQKEDSVDQIADRYAVSVDQLLRANQLQIDAIAEGEVLYIPHQVDIKRVYG